MRQSAPRPPSVVPPPVGPLVQPSAEPRASLEPPSFLLAARGVAEVWRGRAALGASIGFARSSGRAVYGIKLGFLSPTSSGEIFRASYLGAWFADFTATRPIWRGNLALVPGVGVRGFFSERGVRVNAKERLVLRGVVPQLTLGIAYRL